MKSGTISLLRRPALLSKGRSGLLVVSTIGLALAAIWVTFTIIACETYVSEWKAAATYADNLGTLFVRDISRTIELYDLSIKSATIDAADPQVLALPADLRRRVIFDRSADASGFGSMIILDRNGRVVGDSRNWAKVGLDLHDRDYFSAQRDGALLQQPFVGHLMKSRITGHLMLGLSRPILAANGLFDGVVCGNISFEFFEQLFGAIALPRDSSVMMIHADHTVLMRVPFRDDDLGHTLETPAFLAAQSHDGGTFVQRSPFDGIERLYVMRRVGDLPIYLTVGLSTRLVFAHWVWRAELIGFGFVVLSVIILLLAFTLTRELNRRAAAEKTLSALASTDSLTHLANRRRFDEILGVEWRRAIRESTSIALLMIDGDFFKAFNDTYGHLEGDSALKVIADTLRFCVERPGDLVARFGGEEFVVLLPRTDRDGAYKIAVTMRQAIADAAPPHSGSPFGRLTVSIGVAARSPVGHDMSADLIEAADAALYTAKAEGRDSIARDGVRPVDADWRALRPPHRA